MKMVKMGTDPFFSQAQLRKMGSVPIFDFVLVALLVAFPALALWLPAALRM